MVQVSLSFWVYTVIRINFVHKIIVLEILLLVHIEHVPYTYICCCKFNKQFSRKKITSFCARQNLFTMTVTYICSLEGDAV